MANSARSRPALARIGTVKLGRAWLSAARFRPSSERVRAKLVRVQPHSGRCWCRNRPCAKCLAVDGPSCTDFDRMWIGFDHMHVHIVGHSGLGTSTCRLYPLSRKSHVGANAANSAHIASALGEVLWRKGFTCPERVSATWRDLGRIRAASLSPAGVVDHRLLGVCW